MKPCYEAKGCLRTSAPSPLHRPFTACNYAHGLPRRRRGLYAIQRRTNSVATASATATTAAALDEGEGTRQTHASGSYRKNRPCQDDRYGKKSISIIDRGARYKVYELIRTSVRRTGTRWLTCACHHLVWRVSPTVTLSSTHADRAAER